MSKEVIYEFIGELAIALYSKKLKISLSSLNSILADRAMGYESNRGLARGVGASYRYWKKKDPVIYHAIAYCYVDRHGNIPWK